MPEAVVGTQCPVQRVTKVLTPHASPSAKMGVRPGYRLVVAFAFSAEFTFMRVHHDRPARRQCGTLDLNSPRGDEVPGLSRR